MWRRRGKKQTRDRKELSSLSMWIEAIYTLYIQPPNKKCEGGKGGGGLQCCGTTFVMLNPIPNLPVLIGHHKHSFTKQRDCGGIKDCPYVCERGGWTRQHKALPNGQRWMQPKPALLNLHRKREKKHPPTKIMPSLSSALSTRSRERTIARARSG